MHVIGWRPLVWSPEWGGDLGECHTREDMAFTGQHCSSSSVDMHFLQALLTSHSVEPRRFEMLLATGCKSWPDCTKWKPPLATGWAPVATRFFPAHDMHPANPALCRHAHLQTDTFGTCLLNYFDVQGSRLVTYRISWFGCKINGWVRKNSTTAKIPSHACRASASCHLHMSIITYCFFLMFFSLHSVLSKGTSIWLSGFRCCFFIDVWSSPETSQVLQRELWEIQGC